MTLNIFENALHTSIICFEIPRTTKCDLALASVREKAFTSDYGGRPEAKNILIFTTDGKCDRPERTQV